MIFIVTALLFAPIIAALFVTLVTVAIAARILLSLANIPLLGLGIVAVPQGRLGTLLGIVKINAQAQISLGAPLPPIVELPEIVLLIPARAHLELGPLLHIVSDGDALVVVVLPRDELVLAAVTAASFDDDGGPFPAIVVSAGTDNDVVVVVGGDAEGLVDRGVDGAILGLLVVVVGVLVVGFIGRIAVVSTSLLPPVLLFPANVSVEKQSRWLMSGRMNVMVVEGNVKVERKLSVESPLVRGKEKYTNEQN